MSKKLPKVALLATGGTIAGKSNSAQDTTDYKAGSFRLEDILASVPGLEQVADIRGKQICNIGSEDMTDDIWFTLAKETQNQLKDPTISGVVITHGTDTMEETAFFLNLVLKSNKPVVLVGAMRPATSISADGPMNLLNAVKVAVDRNAKGYGVLIVMNDEIHGARDVTKTYTTNCATFKSPILGALGVVTGGQVCFFKKSVKPHTLTSEFSLDSFRGLKQLPYVEIIYAHANQDSTLIDASVKAGIKGIVYAGMGNGSIHKNALPGLKKAIKKGIPIVRASRVGSGDVYHGAEVKGSELINAGTLNPQKARILLQLSLAENMQPHDICRVFEKY